MPESSYRIEFVRSARKKLADLQKSIQPKLFKSIADTIDGLAEDPRPPGAEPVKTTGHLRVRAGDYRIIYQVEDDVLTVLIIRIGHRREVYRRL